MFVKMAGNSNSAKDCSFFFLCHYCHVKAVKSYNRIEKKEEQEDNVKKTSKVNIGFSFKNRALNTAYTTNAA